MRNIAQCDICEVYKEMPTISRLPDKWEKIDGNDFCSSCKTEYKKRYKKMWKDFVSEKITKQDASRGN